ncbi:DNA recombination/repair protein RecA [Enterococcus faecium]|nr:DNA recombination/repair protein RecA [Enterococcus faecium]
MAQFSQIIAPLMTNSKALFVAINQARDEMGSMFGGIDSPGGHALHHWASLRLEVQKASKIENSEVNAFGVEEKSYIGHIMRIKTLKSKVSRPQQKAEMYLMADSG